VIGDQLFDLVTDGEFADLYAATGRGAISPALLAMVTVFQFLDHVPDRKAALGVPRWLEWKYALHLPLAYPGFDASTLCNFRKRVLANRAERRLFEALLRKVRKLGLLKTARQRTDSIAVLGAVAVLSTVELLTETLRLAVRRLLERERAWTEQALPATWRETYLPEQSDYLLRPRRGQACGCSLRWSTGPPRCRTCPRWGPSARCGSSNSPSTPTARRRSGRTPCPRPSGS